MHVVSGQTTTENGELLTLSNIDLQSTSIGISRRTALRGAAWSAPVISLAVATPAFAASGDLVPSITVTTGTLVKCSVQSEKHVIGDFTLINGSAPLIGLYVVFTFSETAGTQPATMITTSASNVLRGTTTWNSSPSTMTTSYPVAQVATGETITVRVDLGGVNNAAGSLTATFYVPGNPAIAVGRSTKTWTSQAKC